MRQPTLVVTGLLIFFSSALAGVAPSEWDYFCRKCHIDRPVNTLYDSSAKAHKDTSLSCVSCHRDKGIAGHVRKSSESFLLFFQRMTLPPDVRPPKRASVSSDDCLVCHFYIRDVDEIEARKLYKPVRPIKLRAAHGRHWDYRTFTTEQQNRLKALAAEKEKVALSGAELDELERLSQIAKMRCSRCHERFKKDVPGGVDPNVNIAMKNPMECTACHVALRTAVHPGDTSPLPSAVSCERCHYGKLHQKMVFFPVDYANKSDCLRCHPGYTPEKMPESRPDQFAHKSTVGSRQPAVGSEVAASSPATADRTLPTK
jgi:hypothetical protein